MCDFKTGACSLLVLWDTTLSLQILLSQLALNPCQSSWGKCLGSRPAHNPEEPLDKVSKQDDLTIYYKDGGSKQVNIKENLHCKLWFLNMHIHKMANRSSMVSYTLISKGMFHIASFHSISTPSVFCVIYSDVHATFLINIIIDMTTYMCYSELCILSK